MQIEEPYFDEKGQQINEFAVIKVFHFLGRRRKKHFMYKWIKLKEYRGVKYWVAVHLMDDKGDYYHLRSFANKDRIIEGTEVVQDPIYF